MATTHGLSPEQRGFYEENGYVLARGVFTRAEAADLRAEAHALAARLQDAARSIDATWASVRTTDPAKRTVILHCHDVQFHAAAFARMIVDPRLTAVAQAVVGPNVQLHHTKMFIKPPERGSPFPMHQDHPYFPHARHSMIAAIVHLDDAPVEKGCVRVVPGSHKLGPIPTTTPDHSLPPDRYPIESAVPCPAEAGDVLVFNYLTIHGSGVNVSGEARTTVLVQMRDPTDPPTVRAHESRGQGMMLAGIDPTTGAGAAKWDKPAAEGAAMGMGGMAPATGR